MVKLICGIHNHEMAKSLVGHPYTGRLTKDEKNVVVDMMKSMVKPRNILLTLKEHNDSNYTTIKQIYNARRAYHSFIRGSNTEMQQLMMVKDDNVVRDLFWSHPDAIKLSHSCNLVFLIDDTYKTNRYKLSLLDIVGVTPTGMTFSTGFAYLEGEHLNNVIWALERFRGLFMRADAFPRVIVTDRDLSLMNAMKIVFSDATNLLCRSHIDKNVKAKCKTLVAQKNAWDHVMEAWGSLVDCPNESSFDEYLKNFEMAYSLWPMVESAHWSLKRLLQNFVGDICSVWEAMNNMITLQHTQIKASFETSTHVVGHVFKVTLYKKLLGMVSRYALNEIAAEYERVAYTGKNPSRCGCVMRSTHDQGLSEIQVTITEEMKTISKRFEQLDVCGKIHLKSKLRDIAYPDMNSMCPPLEKVKTKGAPKKPLAKNQKSTKCNPSYWEYVDVLHSVQNSNSSVKRSASSSQDPTQRRNIPILNQFHPCIQDSIENIIDVKANGNCGYCAIVVLLGMGEESWSLVRNHLHKELSSWSEEYMNLVGGIERFEESKHSLLVDELSKVTMDKWIILRIWDTSLLYNTT
ncbi:Protein FAR1-RELATED SEQUENCE 5 [Glycine max]|nr:Protein FAR1-RELATED SEQUENCE 5 [Glycine max]